MRDPLPKLSTILARGWRRRCPHCGEGKIFRGWVSMHDRCPHCQLQFLRDQGDLWAYLLAVDRALFIFPMVAMIYFRLYIPDSKWFYVLVVALLTGFVYTLPHRNGMCLGLDYLMRRKWGDLREEESLPKPGAPPCP